MRLPHLCNVDFKDKTFTNNLNLEAMNALRNKVQLIGNAGKDPEVKTFEGGRKLATISIATSESYTNDKGEKITDTQWHNLVAWGKTAEIIEKYVVKGNQFAVEGKLTHRSYDVKNGEKRYVTEVVVSDVLLLGSK